RNKSNHTEYNVKGKVKKGHSKANKGETQEKIIIDGNRDSTYKQRSCSHTKRELKPWLRLDLLKMFKVKTFTITNRGDCCSDRLNGAEIRIGNSLIDNGNTNPICTVIKSITGGRTETFECYEMEGRYINIVIPDRMEYLTLCEVEVEGIEVSTDDDYPPLAAI
uniref:Fucolectin tachylectin-4 pentraxin-1 domain-containing protein n=1 Tax=Amphiprion percula TaxID=161767 RepID=A0A3P8TAP7_AMPPE